MSAAPTISNNDDVRESYVRLPAFTQRFLTWVTGAPLPGQRPLFEMTPYRYLMATVLRLAIGVSLTVVAPAQSWAIAALFMGIGWLLITGSARILVSTICHQCVHRQFSGHARGDQLVSEVITTLLVTQSFEDYRRDHLTHHQGSIFTTAEDPSAQLLMRCGFRPGKTRKQLWRRVPLTMVSPWFHGYFLAARLSSNFLSAGLVRRSMAIVNALAWAAVITLLDDGLRIFLCSYFIPIGLLYQNSVFLEFSSEHAWLASPFSANRREDLRHRSWARFCGSRLPKRSRSQLVNTGRMAVWWMKMVFYHVPIRLFVLPGDLPQHDYHHRAASTKYWASAAYARREEKDKSGSGYQEVWGLHRALDRVICGIASLKPASQRES